MPICINRANQLAGSGVGGGGGGDFLLMGLLLLLGLFLPIDKET
jgi:hypothetical protein